MNLRQAKHFLAGGHVGYNPAELTALNQELSRIGVTPSQGGNMWFHVSGGSISFSGGGDTHPVNAPATLKALKMVPVNADPEVVWDAIQ